MAVTRLFGSRIKRREDPRLITGSSTFTDDINLPGMCYAVFVRSPHAHAKIKSISVDEAKKHPGVVAVFTGKDLEGKVNPIPTAWLIPDSDLKTPPHPALAVDRVRYVGDAVAVVVATTKEAAYDAAEKIEVEYEPLPAVVDAEKAMQDKAPQLHDDVPKNIAFHWKVSGGNVDEAFKKADVVIKQRMTNHRLIPNAMEPRSTVAKYDSATGELTVWMTSQNPHIHRFLLSVILGIPEHHVRVIATEVGGGFGSKIPCYPDEAVVSFCSMQIGRPVKWTETRRENFLATIHGRDHIVDLELAAKKDGTILGIRGTCYANLGAYLSTAAPGIPTILHGLMMSGAYDIPNIEYHVYGVFTNTTPVDAYRGAGRPEATYYVERLVDLLANELNMDPVEIRKKNFIPKDKFPHTVATGIIYDSGDYEKTLNKVLEKIDYEKFRKEQEKARGEGRYIGIGFSTYVEICGLGPSQVAGAVGFQGGLWESALVRIHPTGKVSVMIGANPHGQGEETTFAQIVADQLGVPIEDVEILHGDTDMIQMGWGTYGSRTTPVASAAIVKAIEKIVDKGKAIAAHLLEASKADIVFEDGKFYVKGTPEKAKTIQDVALQAHLAWNLPEGIEPALEATAFYDPPNFTYPFGAHACVVEVDPETGQVKILRYVAVDDCGPVINPLIVDGQVHGGLTQGIAQALYEYAVYDDQGQLLTSTLNEYAVPKAHQLPHYETERTETRSPHHPLGIKGVGETGTIASTVAVANAIMDALKPLGIKHLDMPFTPERVWKAIQEAKQRQEG
jgi:carbon-monoxide dehydrogenase large subunit